MAKRTPAPSPAQPQARQAVTRAAAPSKTAARRSSKPNAKLLAMTNSPEIQELDIRINMAAITFGDIEMAMKYQDGGQWPMDELMPFLNRVVIGGVKGIPVLALPKIMDAITDTLSDLGNPKN